MDLETDLGKSHTIDWWCFTHVNYQNLRSSGSYQMSLKGNKEQGYAKTRVNPNVLHLDLSLLRTVLLPSDNPSRLDAVQVRTKRRYKTFDSKN